MRSRLLQFVVFGVIALSSESGNAQTVTVTVAGVVVDQDNLRLGDIRVRLIGGSELTTDLTRGNGVFNLTKGGIDAKIGKLVVRCNPENYDETAIIAELEDEAANIRRSKAPDLKLYSRNGSGTPKTASARLSNAVNTEHVKVEFQLSTKEEARQTLTAKVAGIMASLPERERTEWKGVVDRAAEIEPTGFRLFHRDELISLPDKETFQTIVKQEQDRLQASRGEVRDILKNKRFDAKSLSRVLSLPSKDIEGDWLMSEFGPLMTEILREYGKDTKQDLLDLPADTPPERIGHMLKPNDPQKRLLLYEGIKRSSDLPEEQHKKLDIRINELRSMVEAAKSLKGTK